MLADELESIVLFGLQARGDAEEGSDIDTITGGWSAAQAVRRMAGFESGSSLAKIAKGLPALGGR